MVTVDKFNRGSALALVLLTLIMLLMLIVGLNQNLLSQQKSSANYADSLLAKNYAQMALLDAEHQVLEFDLNSGMEQPVIGGSGFGANDSWPSRRYYGILARVGGVYNIVDDGISCNHNGTIITKGWCYKQMVNDLNYSSNQSWQPWKLTELRNNALPCNSYTASESDGITLIPYIDEANDLLNAKLFNTGNNNLCAQPRYYLEPVNLNFIGRQSSGSERGQLTQTNGANIIMYDNNANVPTARIYRITVRAFGKNGNTRVTLQEYVALSGYNSFPRLNNDSANNKSYRLIRLSSRWLY
jgi:Tfp pilus assembly protein PilX